VLLFAEENALAANVIDGTAVARRILSDTADRAAQFLETTGRKPCLAAHRRDHRLRVGRVHRGTFAAARALTGD
jgi:hypothetical protein